MNWEVKKCYLIINLNLKAIINMNNLSKLFISILLLLFLTGVKTYPQASKIKEIKSEPYNWKNVPIVGGGFVDGIIFNPKAKLPIDGNL